MPRQVQDSNQQNSDRYKDIQHTKLATMLEARLQEAAILKRLLDGEYILPCCQLYLLALSCYYMMSVWTSG